MAKAKMKDADGTPKRGQFGAQPEANATYTTEVGAHALLHDSDYMPLHAGPTAKEDDVPLKRRIAWNTSPVDGSQPPCYAPLPGLEHLWSAGATDADPKPFSEARAAAIPPLRGVTPTGQTERASGFITTRRNAPRETPAQPCGVKRRRLATRKASGKQRNDDDPDPVARTKRTENVYINDVEGLLKFYRQRFGEITMKPLRKIATEWVKRLEPQRSSLYGRYDGQLPSQRPEGQTPPWWPPYCPYREPSHLKREHLIPLAAEMMLVHRRVDEQCGKRRKPWIPQLRSQAEFLVDGIPTETFSSSKGDVFNESMKERALKEILPSLFEVAEAHEDYITQHELFEGSGKTDPGKGKYVTWTRAPRPQRTHTKKRQHPNEGDESIPHEELFSEDSGNEAELEKQTSVPSTSFSFQSLDSSYDADEKVGREPSPDSPFVPPKISTPTLCMPGRTHCRSEVPGADMVATSHLGFDQSVSRLHLTDTSDMDTNASCDFRTVHFPYVHRAYGNHGFVSFDGPIGPMPFPSTQGTSAEFFAPHPNSSSRNEAPAGAMGVCPFQSIPSGYPQVQLPFGGYTYGTGHAMMPTSEPPEGIMLPQNDFSHGLPMNFHD